ncbi:putative viral transcription factor [Tupanvirus soda lake]|uniref:Viral transcription factor n=2 Tax=Tupanvirus TaxID=2094720 RepID=A0AC62ACS5_9VIRU|nr:putative viral transcription factor [Tupanvirus soda lake]QKU35393.1 putative viral transcription factor [Tupanvirus soda lake]
MNKKIDFFNKNNKNSANKNKTAEVMVRNSKPFSGSKTLKNKPNPVTVPKRRGRRPKKILETVNTSSDSPSEEQTSPANNSAVILRLPFDPSKHIKNLTVNKKTKQPTRIVKNLELEESEDDDSSEGMFKNDIPGDNTCHKCAKNEKAMALMKSKLDKLERKDKLEKSNKIYTNKLNFISYTTGKKIIIKKTNMRCRWDHHTFTNMPCFLPELYYNNTYYVRGCFCSFNCALAHNLYYIKDSKVHQRKSLTYRLYKEMYGLTSDDVVDIKEAPEIDILEAYGGDMSIDTFRRSFLMLDKEYIVFVPPIKPINVIIEERNTNTDNDDNDKEYVLKRSKPLTKKRSVISSMKMGLNDPDDD